MKFDDINKCAVLNEFFKIENFFLNKPVMDTNIYDYVGGTTESILLDGKECIELEQIYKPLRKNAVYAEKLSDCILKNYIAKIMLVDSPKEEYKVFIDLYSTLGGMIFVKNPGACISQLLGAWFMFVFSNYRYQKDCIENGEVWKSRYEIINDLVAILSNFISALNDITGKTVSLNKNTKNAVFTIVHILEIENLIKFKDKTRTGEKNKSEKYVCLHGGGNFELKTDNLNIFMEPQILKLSGKHLYYCSKHYINTKPLIRNNKLSKNKTTTTDLSFIKKRLDLKLYVNWSLLEKFKKILVRRYKLAEDISEYAFQSHLTELSINSWDKNKQKKLNKLYSLKYIFAFLHLKKKIKNGIHFMYYFDFRGRVYADSVVGYTHNKLFRYVYHYGKYTGAELFAMDLVIEEKSLLMVGVIREKTNLNARYKKLNFESKIVRYIIKVVFFEIGKIFKNEIIVAYDGKLTENDIINYGIEKYNGFDESKIDLDKVLEFYYFIDILENTAENNFFKYPVYKDATASAIQILMLILKSENFENYRICNFLDAGVWYDTYYHLIVEFFNRYDMGEDLKLKFFNRKNLKKTIMTYNYEATYLTCWKDFCSASGINFMVKKNNEKEYLRIESAFKAFYNYLNDIFETQGFFKRPSKDILNIFKKKLDSEDDLNWITPDAFDIKLDYCTVIKVRLDRVIVNRETIVWNVKTDEKDLKKTFRSLRANLIHSLDGCLVRNITMRLDYPIITIHDSFGIDILSIAQLQKIVKEEYSNIYRTNFFELNTCENVDIICSDFILI